MIYNRNKVFRSGFVHVFALKDRKADGRAHSIKQGYIEMVNYVGLWYRYWGHREIHKKSGDKACNTQGSNLSTLAQLNFKPLLDKCSCEYSLRSLIYDYFDIGFHEIDRRSENKYDIGNFDYDFVLSKIRIQSSHFQNLLSLCHQSSVMPEW